jgi:hypothetical protein
MQSSYIINLVFFYWSAVMMVECEMQTDENVVTAGITWSCGLTYKASMVGGWMTLYQGLRQQPLIKIG